ncbi:MAG: stage III sporulation protein AF [Lachnospiraceae bacterium]|nr:stage III sporulation protein AF [Lachnospiraceae bacterium]
MNYLMEYLFRLGSFTVLAQTLLHFTEHKAYDKYIRILCNIMVLSLVVIPFMELFRGDIMDTMTELTDMYEKQLTDLNEKSMEVKLQEQVGEQVLTQIPIEIKSKLNNSELGDYGCRVVKVEVTGIHTDGTWDTEQYGVYIYVKRQSGSEISMESLRARCARILELEEQYVEVKISG